ncbi:hypothetical protein HY3_13965 [Hyphomonas pacifica]|uniref:Uncharacterized protein n=1 Tax=Hyphomonas pacifica TaxID=1280941 RepID=A0A062U2X3_9PROT|nr:hypothetical protein HY2_07775 [Hyphomonas pacifica]RAN32835.1 hypothetical protein HY3_13965 [Hyphomonas pacifica]
MEASVSEFAKTLQGFIDHMPDGRRKREFETALKLCPEIEVEVVTEERANKSMKSVREGALKTGHAFVIARAGKVDRLEQAAFVLSSDTILALIGSIRENTERTAARRRPASALLAQLKPMDPSLVNMRLSPRSEEETVGGRGRVF